ncbi:hypothetical protein [Zobellella sp. DQSA1]|uniref:hypothetical protein n=1 Tax=Zobellella sp. DQSA1 TaxID=3342386 RepID=UPI0035C010E6
MSDVRVINGSLQAPKAGDRGIATQADIGPGDRITVLLVNSILPEWCVHYPASAARIDGNLENVARVYSQHLSGRGLTIGDIRSGHAKALERDSEFAPRPAEFLELCQVAARQRGKPTSQARIISPAAVRMIAESRLWCAGQPTTDEAVTQEAARVAAEHRAQGVEITGGNW